MTIIERYKIEETWHGKVLVMEIYHLIHVQSRGKSWTLADTAHDFEVSIGLVSENLKLADAIHRDERIMKCSNRTEALRKLR